MGLRKRIGFQPSQAAWDSMLYASSNYVAQISNAVTNIVISRILGPAGAGALTWIFAVDRYVNLMPSPLRSALEREVPRLRDGPREDLDGFVDGAVAQNLVLTVVGSVVLVFAGLRSQVPIVTSGCYLLAAFNLVRGMADFSRILQKSLLRFQTVAVVLGVGAITLPSLALPLGASWGLDGYFVGRGIFFAVTAVIAVWWLPLTPRLRWGAARKVLRATLVVGMPMLVFGLATTLLVTLDRFAVERFMSLEQLGYYGIGGIIMQALLLIPISLCGAYFPRYMSGKRADRQDVVERLTDVVAAATGVAGALAWMAVPIFVKYVLPEFEPGIAPARVQLLVAFYLGVGQLYYFEIVRLERSIVFLLLCLAIPLSAWMAYPLVIELGWGLSGVAAVSVTAAMVLNAGIVGVASHYAGWKGSGLPIAWRPQAKMLGFGLPLGAMALPTWTDGSVLVQGTVGGLVLLVYLAGLWHAINQPGVRHLLFR